jgi:hypothetical protein
MRNFIFHFAVSNWFLSFNLFAKHVQMQQQQEKQITVSIKVKIEKLNNVKEINGKEDADAKSFGLFHVCFYPLICILVK